MRAAELLAAPPERARDRAAPAARRRRRRSSSSSPTACAGASRRACASPVTRSAGASRSSTSAPRISTGSRACCSAMPERDATRRWSSSRPAPSSRGRSCCRCPRASTAACAARCWPRATSGSARGLRRRRPRRATASSSREPSKGDVCARTSIELHATGRVLGEPHRADASGWRMEPSSTGSADRAVARPRRPRTLRADRLELRAGYVRIRRARAPASRRGSSFRAQRFPSAVPASRTAPIPNRESPHRSDLAFVARGAVERGGRSVRSIPANRRAERDTPLRRAHSLRRARCGSGAGRGARVGRRAGARSPSCRCSVTLIVLFVLLIAPDEPADPEAAAARARRARGAHRRHARARRAPRGRGARGARALRARSRARRARRAERAAPRCARARARRGAAR